jgi:hypothetical protein
MAFADPPLSTHRFLRRMASMKSARQPVRSATVPACAVAFGVVVDLCTDVPVGAGALVAAIVAAVGLVLVARPAPASLVFLTTGVVCVAFAVFRASPVLIGIDLASGVALFALAGAFAREGDPVRTGVRSYVARAVSWTASLRPALGVLATPVRRLRPAGGRLLPVVSRALLFSLPVGLGFALLLGSADAVFADLLRSPFERVPLPGLPRHLVVVGVAGTVFATIAVRALAPVPHSRATRPIAGGELRTSDWTALLVTVDAVFALFVGVQIFTFFGGRPYVLEQTGLSFADHARSGFWQMLVAATLTGAVLAATWIGGRPARGRHRMWFIALSTLLVALSLIVLASAFRRLVLYEATFGYTWPRLIPHVAILLTAALLSCGVVAIVSGRAAWLPSAALGLALVALIGLNMFDPEAFIADRNIARLDRGYALDTTELASLSADAVPAIVSALPTLEPGIRTIVERDLSCVREELRDEQASGWASFNVARSAALGRLESLVLPEC